MSNKLDGLRGYILKIMQEWDVPGLALAVVKDGEVIHSEGYGVRNVKNNLPVTPETIFAIGSSSKAFTSMSAGILADEGKLDWDTPVIKYMPWFRMYDSAATERATVRDMLSHRTGLPRHDVMWTGADFNRRELVERVRYLQNNRGLRSVWQYSNQMYVSVGYLLEEITGKTWEDFVKEKIFNPLGMDESNFSVTKSQLKPNYALPYKNIEGKATEIPFANIDVIGPAGSINSNIKDMAKWLQLQLNSGSINGHQIISKKNIAELHSAVIPAQLVPWKFKEIQASSYAMGWFIDIYRGHKIVHHGGNIDGFSAMVTFMPEENTGMVLLTNMQGNSLPTALSYVIYDRLLGYEERDWSKEIKAQVDKFKQMVKLAESSLMPKKKEDTKYSHPLENYVGKYNNMGYGVLDIYLSGDSLRMKYNNFDYLLIHYHYDTFSFKMEHVGATSLATFNANSQGDIISVSMPLNLEPGVSDIEFIRI